MLTISTAGNTYYINNLDIFINITLDIDTIGL